MGRPSFFEKFSEKNKTRTASQVSYPLSGFDENQRLIKEKLFLKMDKDEIIWRT